MRTVSTVAIILIFLELLVALVISYGFNSHIYRNKTDVGTAMRRLSAEKPRSALIVKICYALIISEFLIVLIVKFIGVN